MQPNLAKQLNETRTPSLWRESGKKVIKIKTVGKVAWVIAGGAVVVAIVAILAIPAGPATGPAGLIAESVALGAGGAAAVRVLRVSPQKQVVMSNHNNWRQLIHFILFCRLRSIDVYVWSLPLQKKVYNLPLFNTIQLDTSPPNYKAE